MSTPESAPSQPSSGRPAKAKPFKWSFWSSAAVVVTCTIVGEALGRRFLDSYWRGAKRGWQQAGGFDDGLFAGIGGFWKGVASHVETNGGVGVREFVLVGFVLSTSAFLFLQREAVLRFFRSMYTGTTLVSLSILGVTLGVLVPQIESFEDSEARITSANFEEEYRKFAWAEGYFLYHLLHLYGIGMPEEELSPEMTSGLERFGARYGAEEASNREKRMVAAFSGREKTEEIRTFIDEHSAALRSAFEVSTFLDLNRAYKSYWFLTLMLMLFVAVFLNTFKGGYRNWFSIKKAGFFVVHLGMLTLLLGGGISKAFTDRGILHLFSDEGPEDVYWGHFDQEKPRQMPFAVRLDHFARRDWRALEVHFLEEQFASNPPRYTLWKDRVIELDYVDEAGQPAMGVEASRPRLRLEVVALHDRVDVGHQTLEEGYDPAEPTFVRPYAVIDVPEVDRYEPDGYHIGDPTTKKSLTPLLGNALYYDPGLEHRLRVAHEEPDPTALFPAENEQVLGTLMVELAGTTDSLDPERVPIQLGQTVEVAGGYRVSVIKASKNFQVAGDPPNQRPVPNSRPLKDQQPLNPMVVVQIQPPDGGPLETRTLIEAIDPVEYGLQEKATYTELVLRLRWDHWASPGPARYVLHWGRESDAMLFAETGERRRVTLGQELDLPGDFPVVLDDLFHTAVVRDHQLNFLPPTDLGDGWDKDFYSLDPRGLEVRVTRDPGTPEETSQIVELATASTSTSVWYSDDQTIALRFIENSDMLPYEWRSVLSIIEKDGDGKPYTIDLGPEVAREIRVNDYFTYEGYRFFQTNAHPELPTYSGIGVVYDPGIPVVLFGMYTIIAGSVIAFIVRPIVLARRA